MWAALGLTTIIDASILNERSGSMVLEQLMHEDEKPMPGYDNINQKETIAIACWYLW
jgi:hypothetical protein